MSISNIKNYCDRHPESTSTQDITRPFPNDDGCQVVLQNGTKCGEHQTLQICKEFNRMYAEKLNEIDNIGGGDCIEAKMRLQDLWIKDLVSQNEELINALERLEYECSQRVTMLEEKLNETTRCGSQVMQKYKDLNLAIDINKSFQRVKFLESDRNNLLEFVRRVRDENRWSTEGLHFYEVDCAKLIDAMRNERNQLFADEDDKVDYADELAKRDKIIDDLRAENCELREKCTRDGYETLKKSMLDMRDALTAEVADKHDAIVTLKRDIQLLEDQCKRSDQQAIFKDDIIKELRKEIKYYKQKKSARDREDFVSKPASQHACLQKSVCKKLQCAPDVQHNYSQTRDWPTSTTSVPSGKKKCSGVEKSVQFGAKSCSQKSQCIVPVIEKPQQTSINDSGFSCKYVQNSTMMTPITCQTESLHLIASQAKESITTSLCKLCKCDTNLIEMVCEIQKAAEKEFEHIQMIIDKLLAQLQEKDKKILSQCETVNDLIAKLTNCSDVLSKLESKTGLYLTDVQQENDALKKTIAEAERRAKKLETDVEKYITENANLRSERDKNAATLRGCNKIYQEKSKELERVKKEKRAVEEKLECLCVERDQLLADRQQIDDVKRSKETLRKQLDETKCKYDRAVEDLEQSRDKKGRPADTKETYAQTKCPAFKLQAAVSLDAVANRKLQEARGEGQRDAKGKVKFLTRSVSQIIEPTCKSYDEDDVEQIKADAVESERCKRKQEVTNLKRTIAELEKALKHSQERGANLQNAVDLYVNSLKVLEESEERNKLEIRQQQITINNLQAVLVEIKQKYEELQQQTSQDIEKQREALLELYNDLFKSQTQIATYYNQYLDVTEEMKLLQDTILDLEVEKFNGLQDLSMLETRLLKYQTLLEQSETCRCGLKDELRKLRTQNQKLEQMICYLQDELGKCKSDLMQLEKVLHSGALVEEEHQKFVQTITELQSALHLVQTQLTAKTQELSREKKLTDLNTSRIEELQTVVGQKTCEINQWHAAYEDAKKQYDVAVATVNAQEAAIEDLQLRYADALKSNEENCTQTNVCQQEIAACLDNLQSLKEKIRSESRMLEEKTLQYDELKSAYADLVERYDRLACDCDKTATDHNDEILNYKRAIRELNENQHRVESELMKQRADCAMAQKAIDEANDREVMLRCEFSQREHAIAEKLHASQAEEMRLLDYTTHLENESLRLKSLIEAKDKQIDALQTDANKLRCNCSAKLEAADAEIDRLRNEIDAMARRHEAMAKENDDLTGRIYALTAQAQSMHARDEIVKEQMDHCLVEIHRMQAEKDNLHARNGELQMEIKNLYGALNDMNREYRCKTETVLTELTDTRLSRDEICGESRNVVKNVRLWIEEQKRINCKLCAKLREKNKQIARLREEKNALANSVKNMTTTPARTKPQSNAVRGVGYGRNAQQACPSVWGGGSQGSTSTDRDSPVNQRSNVAVEWYTYAEKPEDTSDDDVMWLSKSEEITIQGTNCSSNVYDWRAPR